MIGKPAASGPALLVSVTHTSRTRSRTGIQTVVRSLSRTLRGEAVFVSTKRGVEAIGDQWLTKRETEPGRLLRLCFKAEAAAAWGWKRLLRKSERFDFGEGEKWLLLPEVIYRGGMAEVIAEARSREWRVAALFHDAIPVLHPEWFHLGLDREHGDYMAALCKADLLLPVSRYADESFREVARERGWSAPKMRVCELPGEMLGWKRGKRDLREGGGRIRILAVGTLEPRKNLGRLLEAFDIASKCEPRLSLHLMGRAHRVFPKMRQEVEEGVRRNRAIHWHGEVTRAELACLYGACDFTVYPSLLEGFGLPVAESLWFSRPCICGEGGGLAEIAPAGGCVITDVTDTGALAEAMVRLARDEGMRRRLSKEAEEREMGTWKGYAEKIRTALRES